MRRVAAAAAVVLAAIATLALPAGAGTPTCSDVEVLGIAVHGEHIVRDYVIGHDDDTSGLEWPYAGAVGALVAGDGGAESPGAPSPENHAPFSPGASFCTDSASPGAKL